MFGLLLQVAHEPHQVNDVVFGLKDIIMLVGGVISLVTVFLTLKFTFTAFKEATVKELSNLHSTYDEKIMNIKHGKNAMKRELEDKVNKLEEMTKARIDKTQARMEMFQKENQSEFKQINESLNKILGLLESKK